MKMHSKSTVLFTLFSFHLLLMVLAHTKEDVKIVEAINAMNTTWTATLPSSEIDAIVKSSLKSTKLYLIDKTNITLPLMNYTERVPLPKSFDARNKWSQCKNIISTVRNQGRCASCWAVTLSAMLSDRTCIDTLGSKQIHISAIDLMTCCPRCLQMNHSCEAGSRIEGMEYWLNTGIVSGEEYDSGTVDENGCKPYPADAFKKGKHIPCTTTCTNNNYKKKYSEDKNVGKLGYRVSGEVWHIKQELMNYGPVAAFIMVYEDFKTYQNGVYQHKMGKFLGGHSVKVIGWGQEGAFESGKKVQVRYWLCVNSWGKDWGGLGGYFKILRGINHCGIESRIQAGRTEPKLSQREALVDEGGTSKGNFYKVSFMNYVILKLLMIYSVRV